MILASENQYVIVFIQLYIIYSTSISRIMSAFTFFKKYKSIDIGVQQMLSLTIVLYEQYITYGL